MAKKTYLTMANEILRLMPLATISDVTAATGQAKIVVDQINNAQEYLSNEDEWYSLYKTRLFTTVTYTASTIAFLNTDPDTITDTASGFGSFSAGMEILVSGSSSNDGIYTVSTAVAGTLTLQTSDALTAEALGESVTITAISYPQASDWSRTLDMMNETSNWVIEEDFTRAMDMAYPKGTLGGPPTHYSVIGSQFRFYPVPTGTYNIRERYWKFPTALAANGDTTDLPIEAQNALIWFSLYMGYNAIGKMEQAGSAEIQFRKFFASAKNANKQKIDRMKQMQSSVNLGYSVNRLPGLPSTYGRSRR